MRKNLFCFLTKKGQFLSGLKAAFSFTPTPIVSLTIYRSHQGLGKPNKIYVYDLLKANNDNWLPKQFKHRKGRTNEKEIL